MTQDDGAPPEPDAAGAGTAVAGTAVAGTAGTGTAGTGSDSDPLAALRRAAARLDELEAPDPADGDGTAGGTGAGSFDPAEHADRFEAVHDALVAVLADVDRS